MDKMAIGTSLYDENGAKIVPKLIEKADANNENPFVCRLCHLNRC